MIDGPFIFVTTKAPQIPRLVMTSFVYNTFHKFVQLPSKYTYTLHVTDSGRTLTC
jgi:hypothetical protein